MRYLRILSWSLIAGCTGAAAPGEDPDLSDSAVDGEPDPGSEPGACQSWLVTYDLTGSTFFIQAQADFEITLQEPYSEDLNMGPGSLVLRMSDAGGAPGPGPAALTEYQLDLNFVVGLAGVADVSTDILNTAGPEACGLVGGTLAGTELQWSAAEFSDVCQNGQISCSGPLCGQFGAPPADEPDVLTDECGPQAIDTFVFGADLTTFEMAAVSIVDDPDSQTALNFRGTRVDAVLDPNPPACACP